MTTWTKERIVRSFKRFYESHNRSPYWKDFKPSVRPDYLPSMNTVERHGGLTKVLKFCGIPKAKHPLWTYWTEERIVQAIKKFGRIPYTKDFGKHGLPTAQTVRMVFGCLDAAREAAGFQGTGSNKAKPVIINRVRYKSIREAARQLEISVATAYKHIRTPVSAGRYGVLIDHLPWDVTYNQVRGLAGIFGSYYEVRLYDGDPNWAMVFYKSYVSAVAAVKWMNNQEWKGSRLRSDIVLPQ